MTPERWEQVDQLLARALELAPDERATFLAEACGDDADLRAEVASLLNAHEEADTNFLSKPAWADTASDLANGTPGALVGTNFGHYQLLAVLGVGGMAEVYLAQDARLKRNVALKLLPAQFTQDAARVKRFAREARAVSALNHPNIVTVYDIGQHDGLYFIAMEHVEGQTLRDWLQARRPHRCDEKEVIDLGLQIAAALAAAHDAGIVHRDIKPENVMVRSDDFVKVVDFGLAKLTEQPATLAGTQGGGPDLAATNPGMVLGTLHYMSPEQAQGHAVDARSDIFSLGVVLYELLSGSVPFKGDRPAAVLDAIVHHLQMPLTQLRPTLPLEFERIVNRMLEKERDLRYPSASALREELKQLKRALDSSPEHLIQESRPQAGDVKPAFSGRWNRPILAALALALVLAVWWWRVSTREEPAVWLNAYRHQLTDFPGEERNPSLSPDGQSFFYARRVQGQWDIFWQRLGDSTPVNLTEANDADDTQPACAPDGSKVVFRSERAGGGLFVMGPTGGNVRQISRFGQNPAWSPNGEWIVCGTDYIMEPKRRTSKSRLLIINVASGQEHDLLTQGDAAQPRWSPGGRRIAYYFRADRSNKHDIWTIAADGSDPRPVTDDDAADWNPVWSGDGQYLYFASDRKAVSSLWRVKIDENTGRTFGQPEPVTGQSAEVLQMDLSQDGRRIVYTNWIQDANIRAIGFDPLKLETVGEAQAITAGSRPFGSPQVSPDGQWVAFHSLGAVREDIWLARADGSGQQTNLTDDEAIDRSPRWSPQGDRLAFFSYRTNLGQIWLINANGSEKHQLTFSPAACSFPFWSPDGRRLAYQVNGISGPETAQRGTYLIEVATPWNQQTPVALPPVNDTDWFSGFAWSPNEKMIVGTVSTLQGKEVRTQPGLFLYSFETNSYQQISKIGTRPEWLADNRHVAFAHAGKGDIAQHKLWVVDIVTKSSKPIYSHPTQQVSTFGLSRDNRRLFFTAVAHQADVFLLTPDQ